MSLEIILTVLGVLTIAIGIWNIFQNAVIWGVLFIIGGAWATWLGSLYILQYMRKKKKHSSAVKVSQKTDEQADQISSDVKKNTSEEQVKSDKEKMIYNYESSIEDALITEETVDSPMIQEEEPVEVERVTDGMIFEEMILDSFFRQTKVEVSVEEIQAETIEEDPEPIHFAQVQFLDEEENAD